MAFSLATTNAPAAATEPYGLDAMLQFDRLPYLKTDTMAVGQSSFDRSGGNADAGNFLYVDGTNKVLLDIQGPGTVYRLWFTGFDTNVDYIQVYFDGETTPRINMLLNDLFIGTNAPFLSPLVGDEAVSSGGYFCYLPLPFKKSIKIVSNGTSTTFYYNIGCHVYSPDTAITTWTGAEDSSAVRSLWTNAGVDPKSDTGNTVVSNILNLPAGAVQTLLDVAGPRSISAIKLNIPGVGPPLPLTLTDDGRADTNFSLFKMALNTNNSGATLVRRLDYSIANQKANIYVDSMLVGQWFDSGGDGTYRWRNDSFSIPSSFTAGKSSITVKVQFVSSAQDWNEFYYWIYSDVGGTNVPTDSLDVGNAASESAHGYFNAGQTWEGTRTLQYPPPPLSTNTVDLLTNLWLAAWFDNETNPSIYAPIGSFFAMGQFAPYSTLGLPVGMDASNNMYVYFPMPFASRAVVQLISQRSAPTTNIYYEIRHMPFTDSFTNVGRFKTQFNIGTPVANDGTDITLLDAVGTGHLVGVVDSMMGPLDRGYLEGDERIYVDDNESPAIYGTGTEDFFNAGWYFDHGLFTQPTHGNPAHVITTNFDCTSAYRFFMQDAIPFRRHIHAGIEHGTGNSVSENVWTLAYYYLQPEARAVLTDSLDVDNTVSENAHAYVINTPTWNGSRTYSYDGNFDDVNITDDGRAQKGYSQFTMSLQPTNAGAILRRRFDQGVASQMADVYVDGALAGIWYQGGFEDIDNWRDSDFMIPASFTAGKSSTRIKVQFLSSSNDWNEFTYYFYTVLPGNQMLQANAQTASGYVNHDLALTLSGTDPAGNTLDYYIGTLPTAGTLYQYSNGARGGAITANTPVSDAGGRVIFAPAANATGSPYATFNFTANDGLSGSVPAQVTVNINLPLAPRLADGSWVTNTNGSRSFALNFSGSSNATYSVWGSTNLAQWQRLGTSSENPPGSYEFIDAMSTNTPVRFYRISAP